MKKKHLLILAAACCAYVAFTGCSSEQTGVEPATVQMPEPEETEQGTLITIHATRDDGDGITRALAFEGSKLNTLWDAAERVYVYKYNAATSEEEPELKATLTPSSIDGNRAVLTGVIYGSYTTDDKLVLYYLKQKDQIDYSAQAGTIADIAANHDIATATVDILEVAPGSGTIIAWGNANLTRRQAITRFTFTLGESGAAMVKPLTIAGTGLVDGPLTITPAAATNVYFVAMSNTSDEAQTYTFTGTYAGLQWTGLKRANLEDGQYYHANVKLYRDLSSVTGVSVVANAVMTGAALDGTNVSLSDNGNLLVLGTDYTLTYEKAGAAVTEAAETGTDYTVTVTGMGKYKGSLGPVAFVVSEKPTAVITVPDEQNLIILSAGGDTETLTPTVKYTDSGSVEHTITTGITYTSSNTDAATVSSTGVITPVAKGAVTITISVAGTADYNATSKTISVVVQQSGMNVELPDPEANDPGQQEEDEGWD